jgi:hypothetical protein
MRGSDKRDRVCEAFRAGTPIDAAIRHAARPAKQQIRLAAKKKRSAGGSMAG